MQETCTIWVCRDCMLHHANGECGSCHTDEGHDREPLCLVDADITMGMLWDQHDESCPGYPDGTVQNIECGCETMTFSPFSCEGCGSDLGGERHAMTLWFDQ